MADISKITMPNGVTYDIKDTVARQGGGGGGLTIDDVYPVGSIYMSVNSTSPSTLFGGEWTQIQDTFLLAAGTNHTAGRTGGNETHTHTTGDHTLTARESGIRQHTHPDTFAISSSGKVTNGITGGSHTHTANYRSVYNGNSNYSAITGSGATATTTNAIVSSGSHTHDLPNHTHTISGSVSNVSASAALDAHNHGDTGSASNLPPYLVVYMWQRTA